MRAKTMVLILVNLLLGATLAMPSGSRGASTPWIRDCCRGADQDAYCCYDCCWFTSNCENTSTVDPRYPGDDARR